MYGLRVNTDTSTTLIQGIIMVSGTITATQSNNQSLAYLSIQNSNLTARQLVIATNGTIIINNVNALLTQYFCIYGPISIVNQFANLTTNNSLNLSALSNIQSALFIFAQKTVSMTNFICTAGLYAIISRATVSILSSLLNASAQGCQRNMGSGRGIGISINSSTFCSQGSASASYGQLSLQNESCSNLLEYFTFLSHSFPYMSRGPYLFMGSGGFGYGDNLMKGAGGGIAFIFANNILLNTTTIDVSGGNVYENDTISAGSGGNIILNTINFTSFQSFVSANGGSALNNYGAGSGGIIKISFINLEPMSNLYMNISGGYQPTSFNSNFYSRGLFYGPLCNAGQFRQFLQCSECPIGTYSLIGDTVCRPCSTSYSYQQSQTIGNAQMAACYAVIPSIPHSFWLAPGGVNFLNIQLYILYAFVAVFIGLFFRRKMSDKNRLDALNPTSYLKQTNTKEIVQKYPTDNTIKIQQLKYHIYRVAISGTNSPRSPWNMSPVTPPQIQKYVLGQSYKQTAQTLNKHAKWSIIQKFICQFLLLLYPLHWFCLDQLKKAKYRKIAKLFQDVKAYNFINKYDTDDSKVLVLKYSKSKDYTLLFLDLFIYEAQNLKYERTKTSLFLKFAGQGNFLRPFNLSETDIFLQYFSKMIIDGFESNDNSKMFTQIKQMYGLLNGDNKRSIKQQQFLQFLRNMNDFASGIDLFAPVSQIADSLESILDCLQHYNKSLFIELNLQVNLVLIEFIYIKDQQLSRLHILPFNNLASIKQLLLSFDCLNPCITFAFFIFNPQLQQYQEPYSKIMPENKIINDYSSENSKSLIAKSIKKQPLWKKIIVVCAMRLRWILLRHTPTKKSKQLISFYQSAILLLQALTLFTFEQKFEIPYVFVNLMVPFVGLIWFVSGSYGFGKVALILNALSMVNSVVTCLTAATYAQSWRQLIFIQTQVSSLISIILSLLMLLVGSRALTLNSKLQIYRIQNK